MFINFKDYITKEKFSILREIVISIIISGLIVTLFSFYSNKKIDDRISARQFIYEFGHTFIDNPKYRNVSMALEEQYLYGKDFLKKDGSKFSDYEIDDYLYTLYNMWAFYEEGFISKELLDVQYSYFFCITINSLEIKKYREKLKNEGFYNAHNFLDNLSYDFNLLNRNCREF